MSLYGWVFALLPSAPAPEREKRDSQTIIDTLRDTLEERNATVESLQNALDKTEMLCSTLKVSSQSQWGVIATVFCLEHSDPPAPASPSAETKGVHHYAQPRLTVLTVSSSSASANTFVYSSKVKANLFFPGPFHTIPVKSIRKGVIMAVLVDFVPGNKASPVLHRGPAQRRLE